MTARSTAEPRPTLIAAPWWRRLGSAVPPSLALAVIGLVNLLLYLPGELSPDAADQYAEVRSGAVSDWHSPWLTHVWRQLLRLHDGPQGMLVLQLMMFWAGAALLAWGLARTGRRNQAWALFAVCLLPQFWFYNHQILKDTTFYSAMFLAAAAWFLAVTAPPEKALHRTLLALAITAMAAPIRINGAFAVAGLLAPLLLAQPRLAFWKLAGSVLALSAVLVLGIRWVNTEFLRTRASDVIQSLQIHDLMGIQYHSRDASVWGRYALTNDEVERCYTSFYWDSMSPTGVCAPLRPRIGAPDGRFFLPEASAERARLWVAAIRAHPGAYLQHRLRYFNSATYFIVPALHIRFNKDPRDGRRAGRAPFTERDVKIDYVKRSVLVWPITWLAAGPGLLALLWPRARTSREARFGVALIASGLAYGLAYILIGVATDVRYFLWTQLAIALAAVIAWPELRAAWRQTPGRRNLAIGAVLAVAAIGFAARWLAVPFV